MTDNKVYALLIKPNCKPKIEQIDATNENFSSILGNDVSVVSIPEDNVSIYYNNKGLEEGLQPNRLVNLNQEIEKDVTYYELKKKFREAEEQGIHIVGYITFSNDSFYDDYSLDSRTYIVSSDNKAFQSEKGGYSIFASNVEGTDFCVRLDAYMRDEHGGKDGWIIERCYIKEQVPILNCVIGGNILICSNSNNSNGIVDITQDALDKYVSMFKSIQKFERSDTGELLLVDNNTQNKDSPER